MPDLGSNLLMTLGIDLGPFQKAAETIKSTLNSINEAFKPAEAALAGIYAEQNTQMAQIKVAAGEQAAAAKAGALAELEKQKAAVGTLGALKSQATATTEAGGAAKSLLLTEQERRATALATTAEYNKQAAALRLQTLEARAAAAAHKEGGEGGVVTGLMGNVTKGLLGEGVAGKMAGGLIAGAGIAGAIVLAGDAMQSFLGHLRDVTVEAGKLTVLEHTFEQLAANRGIQDSAKFMEDMNRASKGLVDTSVMLKDVNVMLQAKTKLTQEQMVGMTHDVINLSLAAGNTANEGMEMLTRGVERGNLAMLSYTLAVPGLREAIRSIPPGLSAAQHEARLLALQMELLHKQALRIGEVPETIDQALTRLKNEWSTVEEEFGKGLGSSGGMKQFMRDLDEITKKLGGTEGAAHKFGDTMGGVLAAISNDIKLEIQDFSQAADAFTHWGDIIDGFAQRSKDQWGPAFDFWHAVINKNPAEMVAAAQDALGKTGKDYTAEAAKKRKDAEHLHSISSDFLSGENPSAMLVPTGGPDTDTDPRLEMQKAQAIMQVRIQLAKTRLEEKKDEIAQEKALDDERYKYEGEGLDAHYASLHKTDEENYKASKEMAAAEFLAKMTELDAQERITEKDRELYNAQVKLAQEKFHQDSEKADQDFFMNELGITNQHNADLREAQQKAIDGAMQLEQKKVAGQRERLEAGFKRGEVAPDAYMQQQISLDEELAQHDMETATATYENSMRKETDLQTLINKRNSIVQDFYNTMDKRADESFQKQMQYVQMQFQPRTQALQAQLGSTDPLLVDQQAKLQKQMLDILRQEMEQYKAMLGTVTPLGDQWNQIYDKMEAINAQQIKYNEELAKSSSLATGLGKTLDSFVKLMDATWTSKFVKGLSEGLGAVVNTLENYTKTKQEIATLGKGKSPYEDPGLAKIRDAAASNANILLKSGTDFRNASATSVSAMTAFRTALDKLAQYINNITNKGGSSSTGSSGGGLDYSLLNEPDQSKDMTGGSSGSSGSSGSGGTQSSGSGGTQSSGSQMLQALEGKNGLGGFMGALQIATGGIMNFVNSLSHASSATGGALSGGMQGASMGSMFGPIGAAVGAVAGAVVGGIVGHKNAEMSQEISAMDKEYTSIMNAYHSNTNNLQEAIAQMQDLMLEAQVDEADSKKGKSAFASLVTQYSQQLDQLKDQQSSIISDMEEQLAILTTPTGMQEFITNIDNILKQYRQFSGAAANVKELADANSWLTDSLSSYTTQMENTFVQDEEKGLQDALDLNSAISERSTLISNLNDSIMNVLEQGVLTRQQTGAQKKGEQIRLLESQASLQLISLNNTISLEQYKVAIETTLFNMAMTSMGLQAQLLSLQEGQASQSLAAIASLQQLIQALQNGSYNFTSISGILSALGFGQAASNIPNPGDYNPVGAGVQAKTAALDELASAAYQSRAMLGYGAFRGQNL